jgi:hypothetical protein
VEAPPTSWTSASGLNCQGASHSKIHKSCERAITFFCLVTDQDLHSIIVLRCIKYGNLPWGFGILGDLFLGPDSGGASTVETMTMAFKTFGAPGVGCCPISNFTSKHWYERVHDGRCFFYCFLMFDAFCSRIGLMDKTFIMVGLDGLTILSIIIA